MNLTSILSATIETGKRILKFARFGTKDVQTGGEVMPYGLDSVPIKKISALLVRTTEDGKIYLVGYLNKNQKAEPGEFRTFATDEDGVEVFYTWMKKDGTYEMGGDADNAVGYNKMAEEFNKLKDSHNDLADKWNQFCASYAPGSPSTTGTPPTLSTATVTPNDSDITLAKKEEIKTI